MAEDEVDLDETLSDDEDDPDFDPVASANTTQVVSEEESDGDDEEAENQDAKKRESDPEIPETPPESRKRPAEVSPDELRSSSSSNSSVDAQLWKIPKLIPSRSSKPTPVQAGVPRARITFLSGKPSDIGLGGDLRRTGLGGVLAALRSQKQTKLTTLEKSRLDWKAFKQAEGLEDELKSQLKSRHGFLEKRDFLERTDHRQFELEKDMRTKQRRNPLGT